jgi:hypothetical protein
MGLGKILSGLSSAVGFGSALLGGSSQKKALRQAADLERQNISKSEAEFAPFLQTGMRASSRLGDELASGSLSGQLSAEDLISDPSFDFRFNEGVRAINASNAFRGLGNSSRAARDLISFGQGLASTEFGNAFQRRQQERDALFSRLFNTSNQGLSAASGLGSIRSSGTRALSELFQQRGNVNATVAGAGGLALKDILSLFG